MGFDVLRCSELLPEFVFISNAMPEVTNLTHVPSVDGNAPSFANHKEKMIFRNQISIAKPQKRAADLLLHMADIARKVRMTIRRDQIGHNDGAQQI